MIIYTSMSIEPMLFSKNETSPYGNLDHRDSVFLVED